MRAIQLLAVDDTAIFDDIASAKHRQRRAQLRAARSNVLAAYQDYENAVPEVGGLVEATLTATQKEALVHAYTVETEPMTKLRGDLLNRISVARCPFCGISESSTLDHYLPKERYPEFSVFAKNLVPCCAVCNTRKKNRILEAGTDIRMFLHPCFDVIPASEFLAVRVRMDADALIVTYRLMRPAGMTLRTFRHLQSHFTELDLADRYRRMGLEHLGGQYPALKRAYGQGEDAERVAAKLLEGAEDFKEVFGPNYWLVKLYQALATNDEFCDGGFEVVKVQTHPV